jgi:CheY-like chemotaxis protein
VDDNRDSADSMALLLSASGHRVRVANDGLQALNAVPEFGPEVILLDIGLPGMNGYEVARRLRESDDGKSLVLIAMTGYGQREDRARTREAGFDHHLIKPVEVATIQDLLASLSAQSPETDKKGRRA